MKNKKKASIFTVGDTVKCIRRTSTGPSISPGEKEYIVSIIHPCGRNTMNLQEYEDRGYVYMHEFELVDQTVEQLEAKITRLQEEYEKEVVLITNKVTYLKLTGNTVYDANEFKIWSVLQELKTTTDDVQKAKMIAQIIED